MNIGQYKILDKIGEGGMGIIYKAEHLTLEQIVAIKALPSSLSSNKEIRERFVREAKIQAKISHPNIVNIHNFIEQDGNYYIIMEYVEGETLDEIIRKSGLIPPDRCLKLIEQICAGIGYAHKKGIIHRDIKPGNIVSGHLNPATEGRIKTRHLRGEISYIHLHISKEDIHVKQTQNGKHTCNHRLTGAEVVLPAHIA